VECRGEMGWEGVVIMEDGMCVCGECVWGCWFLRGVGCGGSYAHRRSSVRRWRRLKSVCCWIDRSLGVDPEARLETLIVVSCREVLDRLVYYIQVLS